MSSILCRIVSYQLFRLAHARYAWVYLAILLVSVAQAGVIKNIAESSGDILAVGFPYHSGQLGLASYVSGILITVTMLASVLAGHFFANDCDARFVKHVLVGRHARPVYAIGALLVGGLVAVVLIVLATVCRLARWCMAGLPLDFASLATLGLLLIQIALLTWCQVGWTLVLTLLTGSKVVGVFSGFCFGSGLVEFAVYLEFQGNPLIDALHGLGTVLLTGNVGSGIPATDPMFYLYHLVQIMAIAGILICIMRGKDVSGNAGFDN